MADILVLLSIQEYKWACTGNLIGYECWEACLYPIQHPSQEKSNTPSQFTYVNPLNIWNMLSNAIDHLICRLHRKRLLSAWDKPGYLIINARILWAFLRNPKHFSISNCLCIFANYFVMRRHLIICLPKVCSLSTNLRRQTSNMKSVVKINYGVYSESELLRSLPSLLYLSKLLYP